MNTSIFGDIQAGLMDLLDPKPEATAKEAPEAPEEPVVEETAVEAPKAEEPKPVAPKPVVASTLMTDALEVDYEKKCTTLYKRIENAIKETEWEPIAKFLDTGYWPGSLFADEDGPKKQAMTWVTKFDKEDPTKVRWSQLPLHLAIVCGAPFAIVGRLIEHYPAGVRCTDDQRNLPIHLALRHNASDDVVAYLLMQFPESCNARGKERRTPIQCALRAESKVRGKMLEIFVTKTKAKTRMELAQAIGATNASLTEREIQIAELEADLEAKTQALQQLEAQLANADTVEEVKSEKLAQVIYLEKKIEDLEAKYQEMEKSARAAQEHEATLLQDIEAVTKAIDTAKSSAELDKLKEEVASIKSCHFEHSKEVLVDTIKALAADIEKSSKDLSADELKEMNEAVNKLESSVASVSVTSDVLTLRAEVDELHATLKERENVAMTKTELASIKAAMEAEIACEGKSVEEKAILKKALASLQGLENKTNDELASLKKELETNRKTIQEKELALSTKNAVEEMVQKTAVSLMVTKDSAVKKELEVAAAALKKIQGELESKKTTEEMLSIKGEVDALKLVIKDKLVSAEEASVSGKSASSKSASSKTEVSHKSMHSGSTRKKKAKSRIKKFISKIIGKKKEEEAPVVEEPLILPPCLSDTEPEPSVAPAASFEAPTPEQAPVREEAPVDEQSEVEETEAEQTEAETDEEHPVEEPSVSSKKSVTSKKIATSKKSVTSKMSVTSKKSAASKKTTASKKSVKSLKSFKSQRSSKKESPVVQAAE